MNASIHSYTSCVKRYARYDKHLDQHQAIIKRLSKSRRSGSNPSNLCLSSLDKLNKVLANFAFMVMTDDR